MKKEIIQQHITENGLILKSGQILENKTIIQTGSDYGRFIFTEHSPAIIVPMGANNVKLRKCKVIGKRFR